MKTMIENLINGNVTTAREQAKGKSGLAIMRALRDDYGWSQDKSEKAAHFLKTGEGWQAYCDAD
jgi:hypothetical protein